MFLFVFHWSLLKVIKFWTHEIPKRKSFAPTKYPRKNIFSPRNIHEENFGLVHVDVKIFWTQEVPKRKNFGPTKERWHETHGIEQTPVYIAQRFHLLILPWLLKRLVIPLIMKTKTKFKLEKMLKFTQLCNF